MKPVQFSIPKLFLLAGLLALFSCNKERVTGSGATSTENRNVSNFVKLDLSGSTKAYITKGNQFSVQLKGYSNLLPYFETEVNGNTLQLHFRDGVSVRNNNVEVYVTMPELTELRGSGATTANIKGGFNSDVLSVDVSGSGNVQIEDGTTNQFIQTVSGSGILKAFGLTADKAVINVSGSGTSEVTVASQLKVNISGSAVVYYKGTPAVESNISGSGKLIQR